MNGCRVCGKGNLELAIDLKKQPVANIFLSKDQVGKEEFFPLQVVYCHDCSTAQLNYTVPKEKVYTDNTYLSGMTQTLNTHFEKIADEIDERFLKEKKEKSVLDIGSNDGTQLLHFKRLNYDILGVEASEKIAKIANEKNIPTCHAFFNEPFARQLNRQFDVINAAGIFFHLEELHSVTEGIKALLKKDGVFVIQFLYMKCILDNQAFDQIYHEHLLYYTLKTVDALLAQHGLSLFDAYLSPIHGGSIMAFASHKGKKRVTKRLIALKQEEESYGCNCFSTYLQLNRSIEELKRKNLDFLETKKAQGKKIYGLGAPVKGNTLLNYFQIGPSLLDCLVEKNPLRKGLYSPGMHLPVELEAETPPPDVYFVLAWNFKKEILKNNASFIEKGVEFYFPIEVRESAFNSN